MRSLVARLRTGFSVWVCLAFAFAPVHEGMYINVRYEKHQCFMSIPWGEVSFIEDHEISLESRLYVRCVEI